MRVVPAQSQDEIEEARRLFREYEAFLNVDLCFQGFEEELANLPGKYVPPDGSLLLGLDEKDQVAGCVAVRRLGEGVCEMKRLFVRPEARRCGLGIRLAEEIISVAKGLGYSKMCLDTLARLEDAIRLYQGLGFKSIDAYYDNPMEGVVYLELDLLAT